MAFILFENGKKIGEISDWKVIPYVPVLKNILGKMVMGVPAKDECSFVSPKPINRKSKLAVFEDGKLQYDLDIKSVKGSTSITAAIVSKKSLPKS